MSSNGMDITTGDDARLAGLYRELEESMSRRYAAGHDLAGSAARLAAWLTTQTAAQLPARPDLPGGAERRPAQLGVETKEQPSLRVQLLGPVRAWRGDRELDLGPSRVRLVLAMLAINAGKTITRDELVDALWEQAPTSATSAVYKSVSILRRVLEPDYRPRAPGRLLASVLGGYELRLEPGAVDAAIFAAHRAAARQARAATDLPTALNHLIAALEQWQGIPLGGLGGPWAQATRVRLAEAHLATVEEGLDIQLTLGRHAELTDELTGLTAEHPLREQLWYLLMLARYRSGQQGGALQAYQSARRVLAVELGIEPGPQLQHLHQQILRSQVPAADRPESDLPPGPARDLVGLFTRLRRSRPLRVDQIAVAARLSASHVSEILRGAKAPRPDTAAKIARALGATTDQVREAYQLAAAPAGRANSRRASTTGRAGSGNSQ